MHPWGGKMPSEILPFGRGLEPSHMLEILDISTLTTESQG